MTYVCVMYSPAYLVFGAIPKVAFSTGNLDFVHICKSK